MSKIVLESTCEETANEILEGIFALIIPVITSTDGLCVAITRCIPAALAFCANLHIESSTSLEETIIKSANSSIIITIGGTISCLITSYTFKDLITYLKGAGIAFKDPKLDHGAVISKIIELSNVARKEGLLALEEVASNLEDEFMKKGILLIVDGTEPELVRGILETELANMDDRHRKVSGFFDYMAAMGPAWGMIGTLIGLVNMLAKLDDISTVGPNMAVALITTLYGSIIANWFATPVSNKLKLINNNEYQRQKKEQRTHHRPYCGRIHSVI